MVKNRTQKELADGQSLSDAKETEAKFFADHAIFSRSNPLNLGVANLTIRLTDLLVRRIKTVLPVMKFEVQEMQAEAGRQLTLIGREAPTAPLERMNMLMKLVAEYCALLRNAVRGDYRAGILADKPNLRLRTIADKTFRILGDKIRETQPDFDSPVRDQLPHARTDIRCDRRCHRRRRRCRRRHTIATARRSPRRLRLRFAACEAVSSRA
mmetsp:Transcript_48305/g.135267  ORF Transcript_48305/g.135267 Transcript_48305/m.135267 type:complete len:211 (-) Transcript_48305:525-1157(-)